MNWDHLQYFLTLAREGSVNRSGRVLGTNHTTVARRIAALEKQLETKLFERSAQGYVLTQAGEDIYREAEEMEQLTLAIDRKVRGRDASLQGELCITVPHMYADVLIVPYLPAFKEKYPDVALSLLTTTSVLNLDSRQADVALRLTAAPPDHLIGQRVFSVVLGIYGTKDYLEEHFESPSLLLFQRARGTPAWIKEYFPDAPIALETDSLTTMHEAVSAGLGIAAMPCFHADVDPNLRRLDFEISSSEWGMWVLTHADLRSSARVRAGREFLISTLKAQEELIMGKRSRYFERQLD